MVGIIAVRMQFTCESHQKITCALSGTAWMVIIQHNRSLCIARCAVKPHITLLFGFSAIFVQNRQCGFIGVQNLVSAKFRM